MTTQGNYFTFVQRLLHWSIAVCIAAMFFIGVGIVSTIMPRYVPLLATDKTLGMATFVLAVVRLAVGERSGAPALPADLPEPMKLAAHLSHYGLYALMFALPLLGWGMLSAGAYPVVLYGGIRLPGILPQNDALHTLLWNAHSYLAFAFFTLILAHVAAVLFHALVRRDRVFEAMAPLRSRAAGTPSRWVGNPAGPASSGRG